MQSNRLVVTLNEDMEIGYYRNIQQVYLNSHLVNDFVVRPSFLLSPTETLWVTFKNGSVTLEPTLLAERKTTQANSTEQVVDNNVSQITQVFDTGYEYYMILPDAVTANVGPWSFSLEVREISDSSNPTAYSVISTSDVGSFTVNNSIANAGPNGSTPTDLDIVSLYNTARQAVTDATEQAQQAAASANEAKTAVTQAQGYANEAANSAEQAKQTVDNATESITAEVTANVTAAMEAKGYATKQYVDDSISAAITTALNTPV